MAFDARYALERLTTRLLPAGEPLVHSHAFDPTTGLFASNAFNPRANGRFAAGTIASPRAAFYGGTSVECALWEADLRHVVGNAHGVVALTREHFRHRLLTFMRTTCELHIVDLFPSVLAGMVGHKGIQHAWTELTTCAAHADTHAPAAQLLAQAAALGLRIDGFAWPSRQCGTHETRPNVYVLFNPPAGPACIAEDPNHRAIALDTGAAAWRAIDGALAMAGLRRAHSSRAIAALLAADNESDYKPV